MTRTLCYVSFCGTGIALLACICGMLTHLQYVGATLAPKPGSVTDRINR